MHGMKHNVDTINFRSCFDYLFSQKNIYLYIYEPRALSYRLTKGAHLVVPSPPLSSLPPSPPPWAGDPP